MLSCSPGFCHTSLLLPSPARPWRLPAPAATPNPAVIPTPVTGPAAVPGPVTGSAVVLAPVMGPAAVPNPLMGPAAGLNHSSPKVPSLTGSDLPHLSLLQEGHKPTQLDQAKSPCYLGCVCDFSSCSHRRCWRLGVPGLFDQDKPLNSALPQNPIQYGNLVGINFRAAATSPPIWISGRTLERNKIPHPSSSALLPQRYWAAAALARQHI